MRWYFKLIKYTVFDLVNITYIWQITQSIYCFFKKNILQKAFMFFLWESVTFSFHYGQCDKILENVHVCLRSCSKITLGCIVYNSRAFKKSSTERVLNIPEKSSFAVELPPLENTKKWEECFDDMICEKYFNSSR